MWPRTHLSLDKDAPIPREVQGVGRIFAKPHLAGLNHAIRPDLIYDKDRRPPERRQSDAAAYAKLSGAAVQRHGSRRSCWVSRLIPLRRRGRQAQMINGIYSSTGEAWASGRPPRGIPAVLLSLPKWGRTTLIGGLALVAALQWSTAAFAVEIAGAKHALILGIPIEFVLFGLTLLGVALFHHHTLAVSLTGLAVVVVYKLTIAGFSLAPALAAWRDTCSMNG